jgi:hypothetical protein
MKPVGRVRGRAASAEEEWVGRYEECPSSLLNDTRDGAVEVMFIAGMQHFHL